MATVIRIIKYDGDADALRAALARSRPEGVMQYQGYRMTIATFLSDLPPLLCDDVTVKGVQVALDAVKDAPMPPNFYPQLIGRALRKPNCMILDYSASQFNGAAFDSVVVDELAVDPFKVCLECFGSGTISNGIVSSITCNHCNGTGKLK